MRGRHGGYHRGYYGEIVAEFLASKVLILISK